ncbi:MAG: hypothetical protein FJ270_03700 [Planctomycetes bacterium]|nr:hypothetical protein [Planctomycetota bacterium]
MLAAIVGSVASAGFTGYSVQRTVTAGGNIQYQVYANWDQSSLVFLNAFNFATQSGSMNARHQDMFTADGEVGTWMAGTSVSVTDRPEDSWVTASGLASSSGWGTALDPGFANGGTVQNINNGAGWYDASPGTPNAIMAGGTQGGYRMLLAQIVRNGGEEDLYATFYLKLAYKLAGTTTAIFGEGTFTIGVVPAPGALALLGVAGLMGRRRR